MQAFQLVYRLACAVSSFEYYAFSPEKCYLCFLPFSFIHMARQVVPLAGKPNINQSCSLRFMCCGVASEVFFVKSASEERR